MKWNKKCIENRFIKNFVILSEVERLDTLLPSGEALDLTNLLDWLFLLKFTFPQKTLSTPQHHPALQ